MKPGTVGGSTNRSRAEGDGLVIPLGAAYGRVIDIRDGRVSESPGPHAVRAEPWDLSQTAPRHRSWVGGAVLLATDVVGLVASTVVALALVKTIRLRPYHPNLLFHLAFLPVFLASMATYGLYGSRSRRIGPGGLHEVVDAAQALFVGGVCALAIDAVVLRLAGRAVLAPEEAVALCLLAAVVVPVGRALVAAGSSNPWAPRCRVAIVGSGRVAEAVRSRLARYRTVDVVAQLDDDPLDGTPSIQGLERLRDLSDREGLDRVIVAFSHTPTDRTLELLRDVVGSTPVSIVPRLFELVSWRSRVDELYGLPVIDVAPRQRALAPFLKRAFDIAVSGLLLLLSLPLLIAVAVAIKVTSKGPVFFRQERTGRWARTFRIYKFRTMVIDAEEQRSAMLRNDADGPLFKLRFDPRVTRVGALLRKTSLDELPQLINVLVGDMSLVGPRPFIVAESDQIEGWARTRFEVRPGMTGLWQVSGRSELTFEDLRRLDYLYVTSWSLWWDLRILAQTPRTVFQRLGAY